MRQTAEERNAQSTIKEQVALISGRWPEIREAVTEDERRELLHTLVDDVTITATNEVTVTGTLTPDWCSKTVDSGTAGGIRTPDPLFRRQMLYSTELQPHDFRPLEPELPSN